ncbi:MAG: undecaprenyl-diphosphate phosphatase [SAR324 cluster bacterium]|nr:undecaprenyl-diphosphate phosphatase [SAR324 cluster bacterium]
MNGFQALVLGIVQGLTEFLPISSTAHLRIVPHLIGWDDPGAAFSAVIQLGTLVSVIVYFRGDVVKLSLAAIESLMKRNLWLSGESRLAWAIALGTFPIVLLGLLFKETIETEARGLMVIGISLIVFAVFLFISEKISLQKRVISELSVKDVLIIGICQAFALIPGCSRSGSTITGGLFLGLKREDAARFSFLLGLPAIAGSGLFELFSLFEDGLGQTGIIEILIGISAAFVSGYYSIELLLNFIKKHGTIIFVLYRIILGTTILFLWA